MSDRQLKHDSDPPRPIQPGCLKEQTLLQQRCASFVHETAVQPSKGEPKVPSYFHLSLAAQLSKALSKESKIPSRGEDVFGGIGNMVRLKFNSVILISYIYHCKNKVVTLAKYLVTTIAY